MPVIKPKTVIKKGSSFVYDPKTFAQYKRPNFLETTNANDIINAFKGAKILFMDTEDKPFHNISDRDVPKGHIRRWIGKGKTASPVDIPFCISIGDGTTFYTLYDDDHENNCPEIQKLRCILEDPDIEKVYQNTKFDMHMLANIGIHMRGKLHDTMLIAKLVNENRTAFTMMSLAEPYGGILDFEYMVDLYKKTYKCIDYSKIPRELMTQYANADIYNCWLVFDKEYHQLEEQGLLALYENELIISKIAFDMERNGMLADMAYEPELKSMLQKRRDEAEQSIYEEAGGIFNINSGQQLHKVMLKLGVDASEFTFSEKGNVKLDKDEMAKFEKKGISIVRKILDFKQAEKLLTTYATGIYGQIGKDERAHASINTGEATTGRMSITKPALQTLPKKNKSIRKMFIPEPDHIMVAMDLDQVEYRLYAHYAKDEKLCQMIKDGHDVHTATAALLFNVPIEEVTEDMRAKAKTINFGLLYGMGTVALAENLGLSQTEAARLKQNYFSALPTAGPFVESVQKVTRERGYIRNYYNRRRRLTKNECFKATNALIQGVAADYIKHKSTRIYKYLKKNKCKSKMVLWIHDEILLQIHKDEMHLLPILRWLLSEFTEFRTYITAGVEQCDPSWGAKTDLGEQVGFQELSVEELKEIDDYNIWSDVA